MNTVNRRRYDMLVRVRAFCGDHRDIFEGTPLGATMLAALDRSVTQRIGRLRSAVVRARRGAKGRPRGARPAPRCAAAWNRSRRTGRFLGLETVGLDDRFPRPRHASDRQLVADARAVAQNATPLTDTFVSHGLPAGVLRELPAQIQALEQAILHQTAGKESHVGAKAAVSAALTAGVTAVEALESIVLNAPPPLDPKTLAIWKNARRVGPARPKEAAVVAPAPTPQPATPSSATQQPGPESKAA